MGRKKALVPRKFKKRILCYPQHLDDLLVSESIVRGLPINTVAMLILEAHYSNKTTTHRKLNLIIKAVTGRKNVKRFDADLIDIYDKPEVPEAELEASKYPKKRYVKKHNKPDKKGEEPKIDIFNLDTIKKPL